LENEAVDSDHHHDSSIDSSRPSRSRPATALIATAVLTMFLAAALPQAPAWLVMVAAGAIVGALRALEGDAGPSVLSIASLSGAAAGGVAGITLAVCPLFNPETLGRVLLVPYVMLLGAMGIIGCLCGGVGGLAAGLLVRRWRRPRDC
jgi:hypothetical protein